MQQPLTATLTPPALTLLRHAQAILAERNITAYLVGGTLRDALLGHANMDPDLALDGDALALSEAIAQQAGGVSVRLDTVHGVTRVVLQHDEGHQTHLDIARFQGGSLDSDLRRRDFTVNALALPLNAVDDPEWRKRIIDPLHGSMDLAERVLRMAAPTALLDDPARLLRAVRIASHGGLRFDEALEAALASSSQLLRGVASDRLRDELLRILEAPDPTEALHAMDRMGLLMELIPEMAPMRGCGQPAEHHWDVLEHTFQAVGFAQRLLSRTGLPHEVLNSVPWNEDLESRFAAPFAHGHSRGTFLRLAAVFHDIAKPATKTLEPDGRIRFFGHSEAGAIIAEEVMERLRFSRRAIRHMKIMVTEHLRPTQMAPRGEEPTKRAVWRYLRDLQDAAIDTLFLSLADHLAARGPDFEFPRWKHHAIICASVLRNDSRHGETKKPRLVTGHDLMKTLALAPGPSVGRLLEAVDSAVGAGEITTREDAFQLARQLLNKEPCRGSRS